MFETSLHTPKRHSPARGVQVLLLAMLLFSHVVRADFRVTRAMSECDRLLTEQGQMRPAIFNPARPTVVLVDGYSSGRLMPEAFRRAGLQVVHVHSAGVPPKNFASTFWPSSYEKSFAYTGKFKPLIRELESINVVAALPGTDTGVLFGDRIAAALHANNPLIPSNGINLARKDKFKMQGELRKHGLASIDQMFTSDPEESINWMRRKGLLGAGRPAVVIKPLSSAGSENVIYPVTEAEVRRIFRKLVGQRDKLGNVNAGLLTQEKLTGTEYVVNSTLSNGKRQVTGIWEYHKRLTKTDREIYDFDILKPFDGDVQRQLLEYDQNVSNALGIRFGNTHAEIMMTDDRGPTLIETNNRIMGSGLPALERFATGRSQSEVSALALTDPDAFANLPEGYELRKNVVVFSIANLYGRQVRLNPNVREVLRRLPGYFQDFLHVKPNTLMVPTKDIWTHVGEVWLMHKSMRTLMRTVDTLHHMERDGTLFSDR